MEELEKLEQKAAARQEEKDANSRENLKKIHLSDVAKSALKGTSATKANEANGVEQTELNPEKITKGETKND